MSDRIEKHPPERDQDHEPGAQHDATEQPEATPLASRTRRKRFGLVAAVAVPAIVVVLAMSTSGGSGRSPPPRPATTPSPQVTAAQRINALLSGIPESGNALGSPTAPVTLQFFGDLECPTSREFTVGALPSLIGRWVRGGQLRIEYRSLETATREPEVFTAQQVAALAAGMQARLWYYLELFYHEQGTEDSGYVTEGYLRGLAHQTPGLNLELWREDRADPRLSAEVAADERAAAGHGFHSTPSFLIGLTGSRQPVKLLEFSTIEPAAFNTEISRLLAEARSRVRSRASVSAGGGAHGGRAADVDWLGSAGASERSAAC